MLLRELRFLWLATGGTSPWPVGARAGAGAAAGAGAGVSACPCADPAMCRSLSPQPNYTAHRMAFHVNTNGGIVTAHTRRTILNSTVEVRMLLRD